MLSFDDGCSSISSVAIQSFENNDNFESFPSSGPFDSGNNNGLYSIICSVSFQPFDHNSNYDSFPQVVPIPVTILMTVMMVPIMTWLCFCSMTVNHLLVRMTIEAVSMMICE